MGQLAIPSPYYLSWTLSDLEIVACNLRNFIHSTLFCLSIWSTCLFCLWSYCPVCRRRQVAAPPSHCSCLEIYISQKIRLYKGDFEGKFQFNLQAKSITFLGWKFRYIKLIFLLFFVEFVKSTAIYTLLLLLQRVVMFHFRFDAKIAILYHC